MAVNEGRAPCGLWSYLLKFKIRWESNELGTWTTTFPR
jgi:hypothetical protein